MDFSIFGKFEQEARICLEALMDATPKSIVFHDKFEPNLSTKKDDGSVVTIFDHIVQGILLHHIVPNFPNDAIIAEEHFNDECFSPEYMQKVMEFVPEGVDIEKLFMHPKLVNRIALKDLRYWAIDPIDGTGRGFRGKDGQWSIAIAIIEKGDCVFSAVGWPNAPVELTGREKQETLYCMAARGRGAWITNGENGFERVRVNPDRVMSRSIQATGKNPAVGSRLDRMYTEMATQFPPLKFCSMTKAISMCLGLGDSYVRPSLHRHECTYDIAPVSMFVEEAGGFVTTSDGSPLRFSNRGYVTGDTGIIMTGRDKSFHFKLCDAFQDAFDDWY